MLRALLSDSYRPIEDLDLLLAALAGVRQSGRRVEVRSCDLTEARMYVTVACPEVAAMAPALLAGYRSPFTGARGGAAPGSELVMAGRPLRGPRPAGRRSRRGGRWCRGR